MRFSTVLRCAHATLRFAILLVVLERYDEEFKHAHPLVLERYDEEFKDAHTPQGGGFILRLKMFESTLFSTFSF